MEETSSTNSKKEETSSTPTPVPNQPSAPITYVSCVNKHTLKAIAGSVYVLCGQCFLPLYTSDSTGKFI